MKKCNKCGEEKPLTEFYKNKINKKDGHDSICKRCKNEQNKRYYEENKERVLEQNKLYHQENKERVREQNKLYHQENKERVREQKKRYYEENKERVREQKKRYYEENYEKNKERVREQKKRYRQENKERVREQKKRYYEENYEKNKINHNMSTAICKTLKKRNLSKNNSSWTKHVDYTLEELKRHLEKRFQPWMNWDNYGVYEKDKQKWHIDHIKPQSLFEIKEAGDEQFKKCWALENLRPLEAIENMSKGAKLLEDLGSI